MPRLDHPPRQTPLLIDWNRVLIVVAAPKEAQAVLRGLGKDPDRPLRAWERSTISERFELVVSGIGKVNAAGATTRAILERRPDAVLNVGIAGALPGSGLGLGDVVIADACVYADEGLQTPEKFETCAELGFPLTSHDFSGPEVPVDAEVLRALSVRKEWNIGRIATVSTCSGTDLLAREVRKRTIALAEAMEGAAVAHVARILRVPAGEVRIVSNTTGDRDRQDWNIRAALDQLSIVIGQL
jgi:futalosine hydrolase